MNTENLNVRHGLVAGFLLCFLLTNVILIKFNFIQVIQNNLNPKWKPFQIPVQQLCNGDYDRTIRVSFTFWIFPNSL